MHRNLIINARILGVSASLALLCAALVSCNLPDSSSSMVSIAPTTAVTGCETLRDALVLSYLEQLTETQRCAECMRRVGRAALPAFQNVSSSFGASDTQAAASVAMDGRGLIYTIADGVLTLRRLTSAGQVELLSELPVTLFNAELFLDEKAARIIVTGHEPLRDLKQPLDTTSSARRPISIGAISSGRTALVFVDVSDPVRPAIIQQLIIDGALIGRVRTQGQYQIITRRPLTVPAVVKNDPSVQALVRTMGEQSAAGADASNTEHALTDAISRALASDIQLIAPTTCANVVHPPSTEPVSEMVTLTSVSTEGNVLSSVAALGRGQSVYVSQHSLYILQTQYLSNAVATAIFQFGLNAAGASFQRSAIVNGALPGLAGIDEHDGVLRIVTTNLVANGISVNMILNSLNAASPTSVLESLASFELVRDVNLSAVKFTSSRLFVATQGERSTLHIFNIENAAHPMVLAEPQHAAWVDALVLLGADRMMIIGHTLSDTDSAQQLHLSVLDIATPANPPLLCESSAPSSPQMKSSMSTAQNDERALAFYDPRGLLAIPVTEFSDRGEIQFSGVVVYDLNPFGGCKEMARSTDDDQTILGSIGQHIGIAQVDRRMFLLKVAPRNFTAQPLNTWSAVF